MKIDSIYHKKESRKSESKGAKKIASSSKDAVHHPFLIEREYVRALNATKLDRVFAKPFVASLSHHKEGINKLAKSNSTLFASSSYDNNVIVWDLKTRQLVNSISKDSVINGIAFCNENILITQNKTVELSDGKKTIQKYNTDFNLAAVDYNNTLIAGGNSGVWAFDINRTTPRHKYSLDGVNAVGYNRSFEYLIGALTSLSINLYDDRTNKAVSSISHMGNNCLSFSNQRGYLLATGNEDGCGYLYDLRNTEKSLGIYRGHTNAVVSIAFNPNGKEVVTGSFDKTIRIFNAHDRKPRDCYYNDRMHIVFGVEYSNDGKFIISGSDDSSLRIWKANASRKTGALSRVEKEAGRYADALKEKFKDVSEISRISSHRFLNKEIKTEMRIQHEKHEGKLRRANKQKEEDSHLEQE